MKVDVPHECDPVALDGGGRTVVPGCLFRPVDDIGLLFQGRNEGAHNV
jgi:hypothetical protein